MPPFLHRVAQRTAEHCPLSRESARDPFKTSASRNAGILVPTGRRRQRELAKREFAKRRNDGGTRNSATSTRSRRGSNERTTGSRKRAVRFVARKRRAGCLVAQDIGTEVDPVRPDDCSGLGVDLHLLERLDVFQCREEPSTTDDLAVCRQKPAEQRVDEDLEVCLHRVRRDAAVACDRRVADELAVSVRFVQRVCLNEYR